MADDDRMPGAPFTIEPAGDADLGLLPDIERRAVALFAGHGVPLDVLSQTTSLDDFRDAQRAGLLWVARASGGEPVGFAHVMLVDGAPHLEEIDVLPLHGRRGIGRALVDAVCAWARRAGHASVTLTTYRHVPWNMPFYASAGFEPIDAGEVGPELCEIVREETERGLDPAMRVVMRCRVAAHHAAAAQGARS